MDHLLKTKKNKNVERNRRFTTYSSTRNNRRLTIYLSRQIRPCLKDDMGYGDFKDLPGRTRGDKVLHNKAFVFSINPKYDGYEFFDKKFYDANSLWGAAKNETASNQRYLELATRQLAEKLPRSIIRKFEKQKVSSSFKGNNWGADLADMHLFSKLNKGFGVL